MEYKKMQILLGASLVFRKKSGFSLVIMTGCWPNREWKVNNPSIPSVNFSLLVGTFFVCL